MAGTSSIGGLGSGLDTAGIINQLMALEGRQQALLKGRKTDESGWLRGLQDLNSQIASLGTLATKFGKSSAWNNLAPTADSDKVSVSAGPNAAAGTVTFQVNSLATAHRLATADTAGLDDNVLGGSTDLVIDNLDGTSTTINTGDGSLRSVIAALNSSGTGVRATTVQQDDGTYRLNITSSKTGAASDFLVTSGDGSLLMGGYDQTDGTDASITVDGDTLTSATNTFSGVVNGLNITLSKGVALNTDITVSTLNDGATAKAQAKEMVEALNAVLSQIDKIGEKSRTAGNSRASDTAVSRARQALIEQVYAGGAPLMEIGIQTDKTGKIVFDEAKFDAAYAADPVKVAEKFAAAAPGSGAPDGFAARIADVAKSISSATSGTLSGVIQGRQSRVDSLDDGIEAWDDRLASRRMTLEKQFAALETILGRLGSQTQFLSNQIAGLPSFGQQ